MKRGSKMSVEHKQRISDGMRRRWEQNRKRMLPVAQANFAKARPTGGMTGKHHSEETKRLMSVRIKEGLARMDPEKKRLMRERMMQTKKAQFAAMAPDERKEALKSRMGGYQCWLANGGRRWQSNRVKREFAALSPEQKEERRLRLKAAQRRAFDAMTVERRKAWARRGADHHNWRGGITDNPYDPAFGKALKETIRERDNHCCVVCGEQEKRLVVHHMDYDKHNSSPSNLVVLCYSCHCRCNYHRAYWKQLLTAVVQTKMEIEAVALAA